MRCNAKGMAVEGYQIARIQSGGVRLDLKVGEIEGRWHWGADLWTPVTGFGYYLQRSGSSFDTKAEAIADAQRVLSERIANGLRDWDCMQDYETPLREVLQPLSELGKPMQQGFWEEHEWERYWRDAPVGWYPPVQYSWAGNIPVENCPTRNLVEGTGGCR